MDACSAVEKEVDRVIGKFTGISDHSSNVTTDLIKTFEDLQEAIGENGQEPLTEKQIEVLLDTINKTNTKLVAISTEHRDLHGAVSKVGKVVDRNFVSDFSALSRATPNEEENIELLNKVMAKHYFRQGMDDIAHLLIKESNMPEDQAKEVFESKSNFAEIYNIWKAILNYNLMPALKWADQYSEELDAKNSSLQFKLHRLAFLQIQSEGMEFQSDAILYARQNLSKFIVRFEKEVQHLMGTFLYLPSGIRNSPYKDLISNEMWTEASYVFLKDSCNILGISKNSALSVIVNAGCTALPSLLNIKQVTNYFKY